MRIRLILTVGLLLVWTAGIGLGWHWLYAYGTRPGLAKEAPAHWPTDSQLPIDIDVDTDRPVLVMFVHPECPCTRASLNELAGLQTHARDAVQTVVAVRTDPAHPQWGEGSMLWRHAESVVGGEATIVADPEGAAARRFGAMTSGHVVYYDQASQLRYSGGITPSRAHEGDSYGLTHLKQLAAGEQAEPVRGPVYGCPLFTNSGQARRVCAVEPMQH